MIAVHNQDRKTNANAFDLMVLISFWNPGTSRSIGD